MKGSLLCQNSAESKAGKAKNGGKKGQDGVFRTLSPEPDTTLVIEHRVLLLHRINVVIIIFDRTYISEHFLLFWAEKHRSAQFVLPLDTRKMV